MWTGAIDGFCVDARQTLHFILTSIKWAV
jgi:hypothetical protein